MTPTRKTERVAPRALPQGWAATCYPLSVRFDHANSGAWCVVEDQGKHRLDQSWRQLPRAVMELECFALALLFAYLRNAGTRAECGLVSTEAVVRKGEVL